ncbi:aminopeptidase P N-terminal domain-containing protein [Candidatus Poriferisodalis sp.]|uniref:aminopeptidase P N-terminal domain-containing protein n=1 Tax=Candidatus Poriferisodalis sp. TaxID=3101277 RepID=UPI003B52275A
MKPSDEALAHRRARVAKRWELTDEVVLLRAGEPASWSGTDQHFAFLPHPDVSYLTAVGSPGTTLAFDAAAGEWELFGPRFSPARLVWEQPPTPVGRPLDELEDWLAQRSDRTVIELGAGAAMPEVLPAASNVEAESTEEATSTDEAKSTEEATSTGPAEQGTAADDQSDPSPPATVLRLSAAVALERMTKDEAELDDIRRAAAASAAGFEWVYRNAVPGMTERQIQIGMESQFFAAGAPRVAYDSIVASGAHGAYLHYVFAGDDPLRPATRVVESGDLLLIDAGAQFGGYASDVTRTMVVGADPTDEQEYLWKLVLSAQQQTIDMCRPGIQWREVHIAAARILGAGLIEMGLLKGEAAELVTSGAVALFFPHGLGHLLGLSVHDASGFPPGHERSDDPQLRYLRTDRGLEPGMITTVEPGLYFIDALLGDPARREKFAESVVWERVDELRGFGGIRIEDDVLVTDGDPEVLTAAIAKPIRIG